MKIPVRILVLVAIVTLICVAANAQRESGSISGTILDPTGAVVSGATVVVKNQATGAIRTVTTGSNGDYAVPDLPPAPYQVTVTAAGFAEYKQSLVVAVGSTNGVSPHLTLATAKGTVVEVTGGGEVAVETQTSEVSQEVNPTQMNELPSINRDPYALVAIAGNVTADMAGRGAGAAINGQRSASTDILLDGGENVDLFSASVGQSVPMDSVQEFSVSTSNFSAEYGRASGGIVNVATKSGSNSFHGTAYDYNRVAALASNTYDNKAQSTPVPRAPFTHNQFGYSVGGPVVKNKLFFFNSTEWLRVRSNASTEGYVPDPTFLSTYGASNVQSYFNQYGVLKPTTTFIPAGAITAGALGLTGIPAAQNVFDLATYQFPADVGGLPPQNTWNSVIRVDYNLSDKTQMFGRYTAFHDDFFPGNNSASAYSGWDTGINDLNQNVMFSLTHLWTNSFVTNTKISLNRLVDHQPLGTNGVAPGLFAGTGGDGYGIGSSVFMLPGYLPYAAGGAIPFGGPQNVSDFEHSFSWTHGKHSFKFGGEYLYIRDNREFGAYETGYEFLDGGGSNASVANALISGNLYGFTTAINPQGTFPCFRDPNLNTIIQTAACTLTGPATAPSFSRSNRYNDGSLYFQDNWKVTPRLTLNLGLRWEYFGVQHAKYPAQDANLVLGTGNLYQQIEGAYVANGANLPGGTLWNPNKKNFGPRLGFAYDVFGDGKTSLRGGYGIAFERNFGNVTYNIIQNPPNYAVLQLTAGQPGFPTIPLTTNNFGPAGASGTYPFPSPELRAVNRNLPTAYANVWNLSVEREVARNTVAALEYSGSRGIHGYIIQAYNGSGYGPAFTGQGCGAAGGATCVASATNDPFQNLNLQYGNINYRTDGDDSWHEALNAKLSSSNLFKQGLTLSANYTWSHTMDDISATFASSDEFDAQVLGTLDPFNPSFDRGNSDFDVRNRLALSAVWALPYAAHTHGVMKQVADGWEFTPIFTAQTGYPFTVYDCSQNPVLLGEPYDYTCARYIPSAAFSRTGSSNSSAANAVGNNLYAYQTIPAPLVYGNSLGNGSLPSCDLDPTSGLSLGTNCTYPSNMTGRNAFVGPGQWQFNMGISKNFKVTERVGLQFRSEFYNMFNHSNYYAQTGNVLSNGGYTDVTNLAFQPSTNFGQCLNLSIFGAPNGSVEYTQYNGTSCTATPQPYTLLGKRGVTNVSSNSGTGSLGERRYIQFALKATF